MSGKKAFRNLFSGKPVDTVPMLLPIIPLGAKILQVPVSSVAADPSLAVQCALQIKQLLAPQGMVFYDPAAVAEALGGGLHPGMAFPENIRGDGGLNRSLETTQRLSVTLGKDVAVFAAVPGPVAVVLAMTAAEEAATCLNDQGMLDGMSKFLIDLAKEFMENRADGLVVVENRGYCARPELTQMYHRFLTTVGNIASYYGIPLVIYLQGPADSTEFPFDLSGLEFKGMLVDAGMNFGSPGEVIPQAADKVFGLNVSRDLLQQVSSGVYDYFKKITGDLHGRRLMISVPWNMTEDLTVTHVVDLNDLVRNTI